jgi:hypothetical protein
MKPFSEKGLLDLSERVSGDLGSLEVLDLHHNTSNVSHSLTKTTEAEGYHVCPCLVLDAKDELDDETEKEKRRKEAIGAYIGRVSIESALNGAFGSDLNAPLGSRRGNDHGVRDE